MPQSRDPMVAHLQRALADREQELSFLTEQLKASEGNAAKEHARASMQLEASEDAAVAEIAQLESKMAELQVELRSADEAREASEEAHEETRRGAKELEVASAVTLHRADRLKP
jgi:predicted  nucleic acid-binding Zn-ribbon protein